MQATSEISTNQQDSEPVERRMLQLTDLSGNHNKFYLVELWPAPNNLVRFKVSWGRVGSKPQVKEKVVTRHEVDRLVAEKVRSGYRQVELHRPQIEDVATEGGESEPAEQLDPRVAQLVEWIFTEAGEHIQSFLAVEVEALGQAQIEEGRRLLAQAQRQHTIHRLNPFRRQQTFAELAGTVEAYYNTIPTKLAARLDRDEVVANFCKQFGEQEDRLLQLEAAIATMKVQRRRPNMSHYASLGAQISPLSEQSSAYESISSYIGKTQVHGYSMQVRDVFEMCIPGERQAYSQNKRGISRRELLFHGTRNQNVRHILRSGLICPQTAANGRMLGNGIYLANKASKSANYCAAHRQGVPNMLFVVEAALGNTYVAPDALQFSGPPPGYDSVLGKAGHTKIYGTTALMNDEYVVYSPAQQTIRYLVTFSR